MLITNFKNFFYFLLVFTPILISNISCTNKRVNNLNVEEKLDIIPEIKGVAALGQLSPAGEIRKLASPMGQFGNFPRVSKLLVEEGDFVEKGTILVVFENREKLKADLEKNEGLLKTNGQEILLKIDQIERYELAVKKNAYSKVLLAQKKDELLKLQKEKLINLAEINSLNIDLFNSQLRSPINGYILSINTRPGERSNSEGVLEIGASQKMEALIEVYESDIDRVFVKQNVELTSENGGFKDLLYGKVIRINPQVQQRKVLSTDPTGDADARIVQVFVKLDQKSIDKVKSFAGMKVIARFIPK